MQVEMRPDLTLEGEMAKAPRPLTPELRRRLSDTLDKFGRIFEELRLIADAPLGDPLVVPDFGSSGPAGSPLFLTPLGLSARSCDAEGRVRAFNVHLRLESLVDIIDQYDYAEMIFSILHHSISILFELECQFYRDVSGSRKEIVDKYRDIFDFDAMNYQNISCARDLSEKLENVVEDVGLGRLDLSWAWGYYRPGRSDEKVSHVKSFFCECGGSITLDGPPKAGDPAIRCPLCGKVLERLETVH